MMRAKLVFMAILLSLFLGSAQASEMSSLYNQKKYDQLIDLLTHLHPAQQNEESLYYLVLSYSQKGDYQKAKKYLLTLLNMDPSFYRYRIEFDYDLEKVLKNTDLHSQLKNYDTGQVMAKYSRKGHKIVKTDSGLYLYRNGIKVALGEYQDVTHTGFINEEAIYIVVPVQKNKSHQLTIYSSKAKRTVFSALLEGDFKEIKSQMSGNKILVQTSKGFQVFHKSRWQVLTPFTVGQFLNDDPGEKVIHYTGDGVGSKVVVKRVVGY